MTGRRRGARLLHNAQRQVNQCGVLADSVCRSNNPKQCMKRAWLACRWRAHAAKIAPATSRQTAGGRMNRING